MPNKIAGNKEVMYAQEVCCWLQNRQPNRIQIITKMGYAKRITKIMYGMVCLVESGASNSIGKNIVITAQGISVKQLSICARISNNFMVF